MKAWWKSLPRNEVPPSAWPVLATKVSVSTVSTAVPWMVILRDWLKEVQAPEVFQNR